MHSQCSLHSQDHKLLSLFDLDDILVARGSHWSVGLPPLDRSCLQLTHEKSNYNHFVLSFQQLCLLAQMRRLQYLWSWSGGWSLCWCQSYQRWSEFGLHLSEWGGEMGEECCHRMAPESQMEFQPENKEHRWCYSMHQLHVSRSLLLWSSAGRSIQILYLSKSTNTAM